MLPKVININKYNLPNNLLKQWSIYVESDKTNDTNGTNRRILYEEFIDYAKEINKNNSFKTNYEKKIFSEKYPLVPYDMRYFYRLADPILCILDNNLTFFKLDDIDKINKDNEDKDKYVVFAGTMEYFILHNADDSGIYKATEENDNIVLLEKLADSFDLYLQKLVNKGDILGGVLNNPQYEYVNKSIFHKYENEEDLYLTLYEKLNESTDEEIIPIVQMNKFLEHSYRIGWDYNTGHRLKIIYSLEGINVPDILNKEDNVITENTNIYDKPQIISIIDMTNLYRKEAEMDYGPITLESAYIFSPEILIEKGWETYGDLSIGNVMLNELKSEYWDCCNEIKLGQVDDYPVYEYNEKLYEDAKFELVEILNRPSNDVINELYNSANNMMRPEMRDRLLALHNPVYIEAALMYKKEFDPENYIDKTDIILS